MDIDRVFLISGLLISQTLFLFPLGELLGIKLRLYHIFAPIYIILSVVYLTIVKRVSVDRSVSVFLILYSLVLCSIIVIQLATLRYNYSEIAKQSVVITFGWCLAPFISGENHRFVLYLIFVSVVPVVIADLLSFLGFIPLGATSTSVVSFLSVGVIGVPVSFGTHGTVLVTSFFSGAALYMLYKRSYLYLLLLTLIVTFIIISQSRSTMLALLLPLTFIFIIFVDTYRRLIYLLCVGGIFASVMYYYITARLLTVSSRLIQYEQAISVIIQYPAFGIGWDEFSIRYGAHLHNTPLNYFVSNGFFTGLIFCTALFYPIYKILNNKDVSDGNTKLIVATHIAIYSAVIVELLFYPQFPSIHMLVIGIVCCSFTETRG